MSENLSGVSSQSAALYVNALGVLRPAGYIQLLTQAAECIFQVFLSKMQPVELAMVIQALGRAGMGSTSDILVEAALKRLQAANDLKVSMVASVVQGLGQLNYASRNLEGVEAFLSAVCALLLQSLPTMHSDMVAQVGLGLALMQPQPSSAATLWQPISDRLIATASLFGDAAAPKVMEMLAAVASNSALTVTPQMAQLRLETEKRLLSCANYVSIPSLQTLADSAKSLGGIPQPISQALGVGLLGMVQHHRYAPRELCDAASAALELKVQNDDLFALIVEKGLPREPSPTSPPLSPEAIEENRVRYISSHYGVLMKLRLLCEQGLTNTQVRALSAMWDLLRDFGPRANPAEQLAALKHMALTPNFGTRQTKVDEKISGILLDALQKNAAQCRGTIPQDVLDECSQSIDGSGHPIAPRVKAIIKQMS